MSARAVSLISSDGQSESCWIGDPTLMYAPYERALFAPSTSLACISRYIGDLVQSENARDTKDETQIKAMVNIAADKCNEMR